MQKGDVQGADLLWRLADGDSFCGGWVVTVTVRAGLVGKRVVDVVV